MDELLERLAPLIMNENVYEIAIESFHEVYTHQREGWVKEAVFTKKEELYSLVEGLKKAFSISDDEAMFSRYISEILSISVVLPPMAFKGPSIRIFKLPKVAYNLDTFIEWKVINQKGREVLENILKSRKGVICGGDFGSGKTTLFNVLLNSLPKESSIVSIEPSPDISLQRERVCRLMPRGSSDREIHEVLEAASRMAGDYITLSWMSEPWVAPYIDLLKTNACGITVSSGNSPQNVLDRILRQAVVSSLGYNLEEAAINVADVFKYLVFQEKLRDSDRREITSIKELVYKSGEIFLKDLYKN